MAGKQTDPSLISHLASVDVKQNGPSRQTHTHTHLCVSLLQGSRRDHEQGGGAGLRKLDFYRFGLFLNSSATDIVFVTLPSTAVETAIAQCTSRCPMARGHRLNTSIVLAAVHVSLRSFSGGIRGRAFTLSSPYPPVPIPNKQPRFCGRKAIWSRSQQLPSELRKCVQVEVVILSSRP